MWPVVTKCHLNCYFYNRIFVLLTTKEKDFVLGKYATIFTWLKKIPEQAILFFIEYSVYIFCIFQSLGFVKQFLNAFVM